MPFDPEIPRTPLPLTSASFSHWTRRGFSSGVHRGRILPRYKDRSASFPRISFRRRFARSFSFLVNGVGGDNDCAKYRRRRLDERLTSRACDETRLPIVIELLHALAFERSFRDVAIERFAGKRSAHPFFRLPASLRSLSEAIKLPVDTRGYTRHEGCMVFTTTRLPTI